MKMYVRTTMMRIKKPNMTLNDQQKNILKSNVLSHGKFKLSYMLILNKKTLLSMLSISMLVILTACQPKNEVDNENNSSSKSASTVELIVAKTVELKTPQSQSCDESGCTRYQFQTVETNLAWINEYFRDRILKADPVAFQKDSSAPKVEAVEEKDVNQSTVIVRFVGQNQHLATFEMLTYSYSAGAAHGMYHKEFVNFDLKHKKRIALEDLMVSGAEDQLRDMLYDTNTNWLMEHTIDKDRLKVSDNFYYGANGIVFVYPLYELASYAEGMSELTLRYQSSQKLIKAEYLPNLPHYKAQ